MKYQKYVISSRRAKNVKAMQELAGEDCLFVINGEDEAEYTQVTKKYVCVHGGLMGARNWAIEDAFAQGKYCVQLSDDLAKVKKLCADGTTQGVTIDYAIETIITEMEKTPYFYGGLAPTDNAFFGAMEVKNRHFIVGDFVVIRPHTPLRYDVQLKLKEDYDYTCQNLAEYGGVVRLDYLLASFKHRTNKGGAVDYRTAQLEQETINYLKNKWQGVLKDNPKRQNEIILRWKI